MSDTVINDGYKAKDELLERINESKKVTRNDLKKVMNLCYEKTLSGLPGFKSCYVLADEYKKRYKNPKKAAEKMINVQTKKCTTAGVITGLGGILSLPIAVPVDLTSCILIQLQMICTVAVLGGYDPTDDEVRAMIFICLIGESLTESVNRAGEEIATKAGTKLVDWIPGRILTKVNQKIGGRIITKYGATGIIRLIDLVPVLSGVVSGGVNYMGAKKIGEITLNEFL